MAEKEHLDTIKLLKCFRTTIICHPMKCICCGRATPHRLIMTLFVMFGIILCYTQRVCLSLAITEMTIPANTTESKEGNEVCSYEGTAHDRPTIDPIQGGKYDWDETVQSYLLMGFYIGYLIFNIPAGYLCDRFGSKWVVVIGCGVSSLCTALVPFATIYTTWEVVVFLRVMTGVGQAGIYPAATQLMARWIPDAERALTGGVVLSALSIGTIAGNIPSAFILEELESWVWVFYTYGIVGAIFVILFSIFVFSTPDDHPFITDEEKDYLATQISVPEKHTVPFKAIFSDVCVWACVICQFGNDYCLFTIITNLPKYLNDVLKFTSKESGLLVCIPQVALFFSSFIAGSITDAMVYRVGVKKVYMRIINTAIATVGPCLMLMVCCMVRCNRIAAIACVSIGMIMKASFYSGMKVSIIDITKYHTGLVAAIINGAGGFAGAIAPYTIGQIAEDNSFPQWDLVSYITLLIGVVSVIPYCLFCKAERRQWDYAGNPPDPPAEWKTGKKTVFSCVNPT